MNVFVRFLYSRPSYYEVFGNARRGHNNPAEEGRYSFGHWECSSNFIIQYTFLNLEIFSHLKHCYFAQKGVTLKRKKIKLGFHLLFFLCLRCLDTVFEDFGAQQFDRFKLRTF